MAITKSTLSVLVVWFLDKVLLIVHSSIRRWIVKNRPGPLSETDIFCKPITVTSDDFVFEITNHSDNNIMVKDVWVWFSVARQDSYNIENKKVKYGTALINENDPIVKSGSTVKFQIMKGTRGCESQTSPFKMGHIINNILFPLIRVFEIVSRSGCEESYTHGNIEVLYEDRKQNRLCRSNLFSVGNRNITFSSDCAPTSDTEYENFADEVIGDIITQQHDTSKFEFIYIT